MPESCDGNLTSHCAAARARLTMFSSAFHASECHAAVSVASSRCVALTPDRERARTTDCALARAVRSLGARQDVGTNSIELLPPWSAPPKAAIIRRVQKSSAYPISLNLFARLQDYPTTATWLVRYVEPASRRGVFVMTSWFPRPFLTAFAILAVLALSPLAAQAQNRLALVIGQSAYKNVVQLPNTANDAKQMTALLSQAGFNVTTANDLSQIEMRQAIAEFAAKV